MTPDDATLAYRVNELEKDVANLTRKMDRLTASIIGLTVTIAASCVVFAVTVLSVGNP